MKIPFNCVYILTSGGIILGLQTCCYGNNERATASSDKLLTQKRSTGNLLNKNVELDDVIHNQIKALCADGDNLAEKSNYNAALKKYWAAWDLLPQPQTQFDAATWILAAIGDANYLSGDFKAGRDNLSNAMHCPGAIGNPFLHMRLGQCQFELNNLDRAADELLRAYMGAGKEIFEEDNPKYFQFLTTRAKAPPGGW